MSKRTDAFREANENKISWKERADLIEKFFPSVNQLDWDKVYAQDPTIAGKIINEIIKTDTADRTKPGKRPHLDPSVADQHFRKLVGDEYSIRPFNEALTILKGSMSIRRLADHVGLDKCMIHDFLRGISRPKVEHIEKVAKAFNKNPEYFLEYRVAYINSFIAEKFYEAPESSVVFFKKLRSST